jgi:hypothetical protein
MNNLIVKEIYCAALFSKMAFYDAKQLSALFQDKNNSFNYISRYIKNNNLIYITEDNIKSYIFKYGNTIFIVFNSQIIISTKDKKTRYKGLHLHNGLLKQFLSIENKIYHNINKLNENNSIKKIYITGYYKGGSIATIAAAFLGEKYKNIYLVTCLTFNSLMVGDYAFVKFFNEYVSNNYRMIINDYNKSKNLDINKYNCYDHYKYKYNLYKEFVKNNYHHVSNALEITNNCIIELKIPVLNTSEKIFKCFYICENNNREDNIINIELYIELLQKIIMHYSENLYTRSKSTQLSNSTLSSNSDKSSPTAQTD